MLHETQSQKEDGKPVGGVSEVCGSVSGLEATGAYIARTVHWRCYYYCFETVLQAGLELCQSSCLSRSCVGMTDLNSPATLSLKYLFPFMSIHSFLLEGSNFIMHFYLP